VPKQETVPTGKTVPSVGAGVFADVLVYTRGSNAPQSRLCLLVRSSNYPLMCLSMV